jgi:hypothetical protein
MALLGVVFGLGREPWLIIAAGFLLTACSHVFSNGLHIDQAEIFPTRIRAILAAVCLDVGLLGPRSTGLNLEDSSGETAATAPRPVEAGPRFTREGARTVHGRRAQSARSPPGAGVS